MKLKVFALFAVLILFPLGIHAIGGFPTSGDAAMNIIPITIRLPETFVHEGGYHRLRLRSIGPTGKRYPITDIDGNAAWVFNDSGPGYTIQVNPNAASYAGPIEVHLDGELVDRFRPLVPYSSGLMLEKVLSAKMPDGTDLKVHFTDYALENIKDASYPYKILDLMKMSYEILTEQLGFDDEHYDAVPEINLYLGEDHELGLFPFGGFTRRDFGRAPLFVVRDHLPSGGKSRIILMPVDYRGFLDFWSRIHHVPFRQGSNFERDLAGSVMHEMTHAVTHTYNENLGSTEHSIRGGDWYTEGLARYFETKIGSISGYASQGFRQMLDDRIQFARGGANYYLRYPDQSFFTLRYEASLFWHFFDKEFGMERVVELSQRLEGVSYDATPEVYLNLLESIAEISYERLMDMYFNWVYRAGYKTDPISWYLMPVARCRSVWQDGKFHIFSSVGKEMFHRRKLNVDWIGAWGEDTSESLDDTIAGDWDRAAGIEPLAFDVHEIVIGKPYHPTKLKVNNHGASKSLFVTAYLYYGDHMETVKWRPRKTKTINLRKVASRDIVKIGLVLSNLDPEKSVRYSIELR